MIDTLILDLDGVVRHWDPDAFRSTVALARSDPGGFAAVAFEDELLASAMTGAISAEQWDDEIGRRLGQRHGCDPAAARRRSRRRVGRSTKRPSALVKLVRDAGQVRVALFSNASTPLESDLASCGVDGAFDVIFNSARLGVAKPDPDAFRTVASALGTEPERCLFVDDTVANVEGARAAGMQAERVHRAWTALRSLLERAGLLWCRFRYQIRPWPTTPSACARGPPTMSTRWSRRGPTRRSSGGHECPSSVPKRTPCAGSRPRACAGNGHWRSTS